MCTRHSLYQRLLHQAIKHVAPSMPVLFTLPVKCPPHICCFATDCCHLMTPARPPELWFTAVCCCVGTRQVSQFLHQPHYTRPALTRHPFTCPPVHVPNAHRANFHCKCCFATSHHVLSHITASTPQGGMFTAYALDLLVLVIVATVARSREALEALQK